MTRKEFTDIAAQIERTYNSRHNTSDMQITAEVHVSDRISWITVTPSQTENPYGAAIYFPEEILPFASVYGLAAHFDILHEIPSGNNLPCINFFFHGDIVD